MSLVTPSNVGDSYDVVVVGGGPAGSTIATLLARGGLRVAVFERDTFPRFHIGESLLPANLPVFDRLGCHDALRASRFLVKPGATFYDEYEKRGQSNFFFEETPFQPDFAYNVVRAEFDTLLLQHSVRSGAAVYHKHTVQHAQFQPNYVSMQVKGPTGKSYDVRTDLLVDASGRSTFLAGRLGQRQPLPGLGRAALFAHFEGAHRDRNIPDGNIRIYLVRHGWLWWIPFANGTDSIGYVLQAEIAKARHGSTTELFEEVLTSTPRLADALKDAHRLTPVHSAANFSYRVLPAVSDRFLRIGDAAGFIDPIFSTGVFTAMHSAELAAKVIQQAFQYQDFRARRFRRYETQLRQGMMPIVAFIRRFYEPAFLDLFFTPCPHPNLYRAIIWVLSGAIFNHRPFWVRGNLSFFFAINAWRKLQRRKAGLPVASRW